MSKTLLLADDSVVIQKLVGLSFANEDIEIISTDNGDDAVARAREIRPDVILADVVMPGLSGYEVCEAIKQDADLAHIPVLLLTGTFEAFDEARAASTGANGQITKPFEAQALVDRVIEVMNAPVVTPVAEIAPAPPTLPPVKAPIAADVSEAIPVGPSAPIHSKRAPATDFFDRDVDSLSGAAEDISLDRTPNLSVGDAFPVEVDPNETTSSALFGAPGEGATDDFDTEGGGMALGHSVAAESTESQAGIDPDAETRFVSDPDAAGSAATQNATPLAPLSESTAQPNAAPVTEPSTSQPTHDPLPAARPVDLDAALAGTPTGPLSSDPEATLMVGTADTNAETSPAIASDSWDRPEPTTAAPSASGATAASGNVRNPQRRHEDLLVHVPSADIDADHAAAPSPAAAGSDAPRPDETVVADLDASLDMSPEDADLAFPDSPDPLDFGPNSVPPDDLDFAFDVSEQVAAENSGDPRTDAFASLDDISESQILGAGRVDDSDSGRPLPAAGAVDARVSHDAPTIVAGYDVSTSDLATASTTASGLATPPPIPEPEHLDVLPELPQSHPRTTPAASTPARPSAPAREDDFFEGLATGSPLDEIATPTEFTSGSDLDANEDLLEEDFSVEIGEPIPANPMTSSATNDREPLVEVDPIEAADEDDYDVPEEIETIEPIEDAAPSTSDDDPIDEGINVAEDESDDDAGFAHDSEFAIGTAAAASAITAFGPNADEDRRVPDLSPVMEQRIQETLEKVAWEAFSDLSESIVKQVMGRVEQIAWEVIPEMAETLVREEIRKMKGEDD